VCNKARCRGHRRAHTHTGAHTQREKPGGGSRASPHAHTTGVLLQQQPAEAPHTASKGGSPAASVWVWCVCRGQVGGSRSRCVTHWSSVTRGSNNKSCKQQVLPWRLFVRAVPRRWSQTTSTYTPRGQHTRQQPSSLLPVLLPAAPPAAGGGAAAAVGAPLAACRAAAEVPRALLLPLLLAVWLHHRHSTAGRAHCRGAGWCAGAAVALLLLSQPAGGSLCEGSAHQQT
jgi:hypothetical protein